MGQPASKLSDSKVTSIAPQLILIPGRHDVGNSERFVLLKRGEFLYSYAQKAWLCWDGTRFIIDDGRRIEAAAKDVALQYCDAAVKSGNGDSTKHASLSLDSRKIDAMLKLSRSALAVEEKDLDQNPWLVNTPKGTVDLQTGKTYPHRREDLITKMTQFGYASGSACPEWEAAWLRSLGSPRMVKYVQHALGYSITGTTREKAIFFAYGDGDNGKTTLLHTAHDVLGDYAAVVMVESLVHKHPDATEKADLADLRGTRFALTSETEDGQRFAEGRIKRLSQGLGKIKSCRKYENPITFDATAKIWVDGNHKPGIRGGDRAITNRLRLIHFPTTLIGKERDRRFAEKLLKEGEGILRWLVKGCLAWQSAGGLMEPFQVRKDTMAWDRESDALTTFFEDCCRFDPEAVAGEIALWERFTMWCDRQKVQTTIKRSTMKDRLAAKGCKETRGSVGRGYSERAWRGVGLVGSR
jgi:putative DNA primase/helicase